MKNFELKNFSDLDVGYETSFKITITKELHESFCNLTGDKSPIHTDKQFSSKTIFGEKIGYGFLLDAFLSKLYSEYITGGSSICIKQESYFIKPFYIGDEIEVIGIISNKINSTKFVEIDVKMFRNSSECIFKGKGIVQVLFDKTEHQPLYIAHNNYIYYSDFLKVLEDLKINKGDLLFVHSDISVFGKLGTLNRKFLFDSIIHSLKEAVGNEGTIIMPTFSYSFCENKIYDPDKTKSTVGILTEYFRYQDDVIRTIDPIFSVAIWGNNKEKLSQVGKNVFGKNSIFDKIYRMQGKILFLGAPFESCTFLHYIEQHHGVPYRFIKKFSGTIKIKDNNYNDEYLYLVRYLDKNVVLKTNRIERRLLEKKIMKKRELGNGKVLLVDSNVLFEEGKKMLDENIYSFLKEIPNV
jgi:aminoglycoside 3-N-acetyltransferase